MGQKIFEIVIGDNDFFACDEDGYVLVFDSPSQIEDYCKEHDINLDDVVFYEDEVLDD